jgi:hypothetical protein
MPRGGCMTKFVVELNGKPVKTFEAADYQRAGDQFIFYSSQKIKLGSIVVIPGMSVTRVEES